MMEGIRPGGIGKLERIPVLEFMVGMACQGGGICCASLLYYSATAEFLF